MCFLIDVFIFIFPANVFLIQNQDWLFRLRSEVKDSGPLRRCKLTTFLLFKDDAERKEKNPERKQVRVITRGRCGTTCDKQRWGGGAG